MLSAICLVKIHAPVKDVLKTQLDFDPLSLCDHSMFHHVTAHVVKYEVKYYFLPGTIG